MREVYLAPAVSSWPLAEAPTGRATPWFNSITVVPEQTCRVVEVPLYTLMSSTTRLDPM
ncbi:hypothetical protein [Roseovarius sp. A-2]|uniref:hypothetical protein n=1 Tax=Roseovarius sp. A-2 TaxID=1570360 RepID=UPI0015946C06|nr:hypothetical protein [Roseovarius sp. A-2]